MKRAPAAGLGVSAAAVLGWLALEGFSPVATIPTHGDRPTVCSGMTYWADGTPVKLGDTCARAQAVSMAGNVLEKTYAECVRKSLGQTPVTQVEFDVASDFAGQYGCSAWGTSSTARMWKTGDYYEGCEALLDWRFISAPTPGRDARWQQVGPRKWRFDCSLPGNKECRGVWTRQQERFTKCALQ